MKFSSATILCALAVTPVAAFTNPSSLSATPSTTSLNAERNSNNNVFSTFAATAAMSAFLWASPAMLADQASTHQFPFSDFVEQHVVASAKDKASATGSRVNKDAESLLRLGLPINSKEVC